MAAEATAGVVRRESSWNPARVFLAVSAVFHLVIGIAGLVVDQTFPVGSSAAADAGSGTIFGAFETNGWHSVAALLLAVVSAYFAVRAGRARDAALAIGLFHVSLVVSLLIWDPSTFWLASNAADQVIHVTTAVTGTGTALLMRRT